MARYKKRQVQEILKELGEACGRQQRSTEPVLDYMEYLVETYYYDEIEQEISVGSHQFIEKFAYVKQQNVNNYRDKWIVLFKKFGFVFAEKNQKSSFERKLGNKNRKGKSAGVRLMELMLVHGIEIGEGKLVVYLESEGYQYSKSTAHTVRSIFRQSIVVLADKGYLSKIPKF